MQQFAIVEYYETTDNGYYSYPNSGDAQNMNQQQTQYSNQDNTNFQRSDFSRNNNSAFIPIKDGGMGPSNHNAAPENLVNYVHNAFSDMQHYQQHGRIDYSRGTGNTGSHNDSDELEINELFNIIDQGSSSGSHVEMLDQQKAAGDVGGGANNINRSRPMSVSDFSEYLQNFETKRGLKIFYQSFAVDDFNHTYKFCINGFMKGHIATPEW